jgi:hypothetical protein
MLPAICAVILTLVSSCRRPGEGASLAPSSDLITALSFPPHFVTTNYIEIDKIGRISKFRSSAGHDYHDDFEQCRSMKHYFEPKESVDWSTIQLRAPVSGIVSRVIEEWAGTQVQIQSSVQRSLYFIIFHVNLAAPLQIGDSIREGQLLGTHIGSQTMSDIAVGVAADSGWTLISYFDVLSDSLFHSYQLRGIATRDEFIITKAARDSVLLHCSGDTFLGQSALEDWVVLK